MSRCFIFFFFFCTTGPPPTLPSAKSPPVGPLLDDSPPAWPLLDSPLASPLASPPASPQALFNPPAIPTAQKDGNAPKKRAGNPLKKKAKKRAGNPLKMKGKKRPKTVPDALPEFIDGWRLYDRSKPTLLKFRGKEQVRVPDNVTKPIDYFFTLFDSNIQAQILNFSNDRGNLICEGLKDSAKGKWFRKLWKRITLKELRKFFGLTILMGNIHFPTLKLHWSESTLYNHPIFSQVMSRNRYEHILRALCTYDRNKEDLGKGDKIKPIVSQISKNFRSMYCPGKHLSLDEALLLFKGRLSYKQYLPKKRSRFGIKMYELASSNGYILDILLYVGKNTLLGNSDRGHTYAVIMKLMRHYFRKGRSLYADNYYTSVEAAEDLFEKGTQLVGTIKSNRKGVPEFIAKMKLEPGETIFARRGKILLQKWRDKRDIFMISTRHNGDFVEVRTKRGKKLKPSCISEYNMHMGGIDRADQMTSYYSSPKKTMRWYLKVLFHLIDLSLWNACVLYNMKNKTSKMSYLAFRNSVILDLIQLNNDTTDPVEGNVSQSISPNSSRSSTPTRSQLQFSNHYPMKARRLRCRLCSKKKIRRTVETACTVCRDKKDRLVGLCAKECFETFHNKKFYREFM